jgi:hypothetical protein
VNKYDENKTDKNRLKQKFLGDRSMPLGERLKNSEFLRDDAIIIESPEEKMSDVLLKFGSELIKGNESVQELDKTVGFLMMTWNIAAVSTMDERKNTVRGLAGLYLNDFGKSLVKIESLIETLIKKREKEYSNIKKLIVDYEIGIKNGQPSLKVISAPVTK